MSWWNAKYKNNYGEYEITFASKDYEKAKAVEKICCAVMDKAVKSPFDVEVVVRCRECKQGEVDDPDFPDQYYCHAGCGWNNGDFYCAYGERKEGADNES